MSEKVEQGFGDVPSAELQATAPLWVGVRVKHPEDSSISKIG